MASLSIEPLTPTIGARIGGLDLTSPIPATAREEIRRALLDHLVVFVGGQSTTPARFKDLAMSFGRLEMPPSYLRSLSADEPEIHFVDYDGSQPRGSYADVWHADVTFMESPPLGSVLTPVQIPTLGGDTLWANMYAAYEALSPQMQRFLDGLEAEHALPGVHKTVGRNDDPIVGAVHPVVRVHPETGRKSIFVNAIFTRRIVGIDIEESRQLLDMLYRHCSAPEFQVRWRWAMGDIAIWDNRCTLHYGVVDYRERRILQRIVLKGDRPKGVEPTHLTASALVSS